MHPTRLIIPQVSDNSIFPHQCWRQVGAILVALAAARSLPRGCVCRAAFIPVCCRVKGKVMINGNRCECGCAGGAFVSEGTSIYIAIKTGIIAICKTFSYHHHDVLFSPGICAGCFTFSADVLRTNFELVSDLICLQFPFKCTTTDTTEQSPREGFLFL